jgi:T5SS/PEP-CTERM-associated repeat protein
VDGAGSSFSTGDVVFSNSDVIVSGGGTFTATGNMGDAFTSNVNSSVTVKDTGTLFKVNEGGRGFYLGMVGNTLMQLSNGAAADIRILVIGQQRTGGFGVLEATGVGSTLKAYRVSGNAGLLNVSNGAKFQVSDWMSIGQEEDSSFAAAVGGSDALLSVTNTLTVGSAGAGRLDVLGGGIADAGQLVIGNLGVVNLQGGTLKIGQGTILGTLNWESGTLNVTQGYALGDFLGHDMVLSAGQTFKGDAEVRVGSGDNLSLAGGQLQANTFQIDTNGRATVGRASSLSATALENFGRLTLDGGAVKGALINNGTMSGSGSFAAHLGHAGFTNNGRFEQGDFVELANAASNTNNGVWTLGPGAALQLNAGSHLNNRGEMRLAGATIAAATDTSMLVNEAGGTISGNGLIRSSFSNLGSLIVEGGGLSIDRDFANSGQIILTSALAKLSGGGIANTGRIAGLGQINNGIHNTGAGSINAQGADGTLTLAGSLSNSGGILAASRDATLLIQQGLASNTGKIQLAGGTLDNNGHGLVNEASGTISGYGNLRTGQLTNMGQIQLSGGPAVPSAIYTTLLLATNGSKTIVTGNANATFYGAAEFLSGSELRVSSGAIATFFDLVQQRTGAKFTGSGAKRFDGGIAVGNSPGLGTDEGDVEFGESNFYIAEIGGSSACTLACSDAGLADRGFDKYIVDGSLSFGGELRITSWKGFVAQAGQSFDLFDWGSTAGSFSSIDSTGFMLAAGTKLDYSQLYTTGTVSVTAVPEPESYALMLAGLGLLAWRRRKVG